MEENDEDFDDYHGVDQSEAILGMRREHCLPTIKWLKEQPQDKKWLVKIANLPRRATE